MAWDCDILSRIKDCSQDGELTNLLEEIFRSVGVTSFIFISMLAKSKDKSSCRYHIGCDPNWFNVYNRQKHNLIDPFIIYAKSYSKPMLLSEIKFQSSKSCDQFDFFDNLENHGFKSGMVVPAHAGSNRIGMLLVGVNDFDSDICLSETRTYFRLVALELLEWWIDHIAPKNINISLLTPEYITMLKLASQDGITTREIAFSLNMSESQVNNRFRVINEIFNVRHYKDSAELAVEIGLIKPF